MPLRVGIVGLPNSGKTTLFNALTHAGAQVSAYTEVTQKPNLGMAVIADDRLERLSQVVGSKKVTPAAIRVVDVPGRAEIPGELRQADALDQARRSSSAGATVELQAEDGVMLLMLPRVLYVKRFARETRAGFGA